jgi:transcriptional regulator with XRE-family HTH domain
MADRPGPTLRRRKLVKELVAARTEAGMSARQLAAEIDLQPGTVSKIEAGKQGLTTRNVKAYGRVTGLSTAKIAELVLLAADDKSEDWLFEFRDDMPEWFALYPELEKDADQIWNYGSELVHGLVQTPAYAEAVVRAAFPEIADEERDRIIELRTARQSLLDQEDPPHLCYVLNEAVIRRQVGGKKVIAKQMRHLVQLSDLDHVTIQVLPFSVGAHPGMKTGFTLLRFPQGFDDMDCVYLENDNGGVWQEATDHVGRYSEVFDRLRTSALSPEKTRALLASLG